MSSASTKFYNPNGRFNETANASKYSSPTPGMHLLNLYHEGRCAGACCYERVAPSIIGLYNNSSTEMWDTLQNNNQVGTNDLRYFRARYFQQRLQDQQEDLQAPNFLSLRAKSFSTTDLYPKLANERYTLSNTLVSRDDLPWDQKDPAVMKDGRRQNFKPAGHTTTMHGKSKRIGFSAVTYNILAAPNAPPHGKHTSTPRQMEKTNFMSEFREAPHGFPDKGDI